MMLEASLQGSLSMNILPYLSCAIPFMQHWWASKSSKVNANALDAVSRVRAKLSWCLSSEVLIGSIKRAIDLAVVCERPVELEYMEDGLGRLKSSLSFVEVMMDSKEGAFDFGFELTSMCKTSTWGDYVLMFQCTPAGIDMTPKYITRDTHSHPFDRAILEDGFDWWPNKFFMIIIITTDFPGSRSIHWRLCRMTVCQAFATHQKAHRTRSSSGCKSRSPVKVCTFT